MNLPVRLDEHGAAAPPRENGELAFAAPWESRLFGLTMALVDAGRLDWAAFRDRLIARIGAWERSGVAEDWSYWQRWREALEDSLDALGLVGPAELDGFAWQLAARPHGHDHHHDHDGHSHDHDHGHENHHGREHQHGQAGRSRNHETPVGGSRRRHAVPETAEEFEP